MVKDSEICDNLFELYSLLAGNGIAKIESSYPFKYISSTSSVWPNTIYLNAENTKITHDSLNSLSEVIATRICPKLLLLNENDINNEVIEILRTHMFLPVTIWTNMVSDYINIASQVNSIVNFEVKEIDCNNENELSEWIKIVEQVLFKNQTIDKNLFLENNNKSYLKLIIGYYNGIPAATTMLFTGTMAGVYMVATMPAFRRKGFGKIMLDYTLNIAGRSGYEHLVLQSTKEGFEFYKSLAFKPLNKLYFFYQIQQ